MENKSDNEEFNLEKFYVTFGRYKWLILILILISTLVMFMHLYFTPSIYSSKSILEIKTKSKPKMPSDILLNTLSLGSNGKVEKEIEILQTFLINQKTLEKIDFSVKYLQSKNYKEIEIYKNSPITINNIKINSRHLVGKKFTLHPHNDYFTLSVENSLFSFLSPESTLKLDSSKRYAYGDVIKNDFFKLQVEKNRDFKHKVKFIINGSKRRIYNDIIQKNLQVKQINPDAPLLEVSFQDNIPERANDYITALSESFMEISIVNKNEQNNKVLTFINQKLDKIKDKLKSSENKLEAYKSSNKIIEPSSQAKVYIKKLSELEIKLSENLLKQKLISNLLRFAKKNSNLDAIAPSIMELKDKPTLQLITTLQSLQLKESNLQTELTDKHPKLITVRKQIYNIHRKVIYNLKNLKSLISSQSNSLKAEKVSYSTKIENLPKKEKNIVNISRDYQVSSNMYNYLLKKKTESELLVISTLSDYKVIDKAYTNIKPIKPKKTLLLLGAPLIGLLLGIVIATILQALNNKISSYKELETLTKLPILGLIPELKQNNIDLEVYKNPSSRFSESYRSLRSNLPVKITNEEAKIILLTSTIANEGKTTITSNLASIFQMAGHKSIILSLDLRKPTLHKYFNLNNEKGMSTYLAGEDTVQDIIFATKHTNLHVITSGPIPNNPSELILSYRLTELLKLLKTRYDYIFIDTAPIGLVSDSIHLMKLADYNLVVFRENYAEESFVASLDNIIKKNKLDNISLVLNRSKSKTTSYGYGYGYGNS